MNSKEIAQRQQLAHARLLEVKSNMLRGIAAAPKKSVELAAIGVCVVVECQSCLEWHVARAIGCGASFADLLDAVAAGVEVSGGRAVLSSRSAIAVISGAFATKQASEKIARLGSSHLQAGPPVRRRSLLKERPHAMV